MASWVPSAVSFVAESAVSAVVEKIVNAGLDFFGNLIHTGNSEAELKRLKTALPQIRSAKGIAEALKAKDPSYGEWFEQFKKAVDASEDVLDELEYRKLEEEVKRLEAAGGSTSRPKKQKRGPISRETLGRLREAVSMLDQALGDVDRLLQHAKSLGIDDFSESWKETSKVFTPETTSFLVKTKVFGRDEEKEKIFGWLKQSTEEPLSVFGIVGMGGLGKTTLAQLAYQEMKEANYFEHTIWICVSIEFSFEGLTKKILGELGENNCGDKPLNALQETLKKKVQSQEIFLILDDIWDDDKHWRCWEQFIAPLKFAQEGSKIIFTSRMKSVADLFGRSIHTKHEHEPLILQGLKEEELGSLLYNPGNHTELREIGDQIIKMLKGSPLAAKVIGSLLNSNMHRDYWKRILSLGSVLNIDQANDAVEVSKLSYYHLPANLQVLDLPVNINSYNFAVEPSRLNNLVKLRYMGLSENLLKTIPEIHKLTSLQELTFFIGEGSGHYINELGTLKYLRKLSIHNIENVGDPVEAKSADLLGKKNLRSLSLKWSSDSNPSTSEQIIENLKPNPDLTALIIKNYEGQSYPSWMKDTPVLNLSVLRIHGCPRLKDELLSCHIPYLKILDIKKCPELNNLPDMPLSLTEFRIENVGLTSLPNFHQYSRGNTCAIVSQMSSLKIVEINRCSNLISLDGFLQQANMNLQAIEQLEINNCEKLMYLPTRGFQNLTSLKSLGMGRCPILIGCLNLPHSLNNLEISKVALNAIPSLPLSVTRLHISDVPVDALPEYNTSSDSSGGPSTEPLKSSLRDVNIAMCQNITSLNGFLQQEYVDIQSLEEMRISSCRNLDQLPKDAFGRFLSLTELKLWDCPMLMAVDYQNNLLPTTVKILSIRNCGLLDVQLLESASRLTTLDQLHIENCANITHIPCSENAFRSLSWLYISGCDKLIEHSSREPAHGVNLNGINLASLKINSLLIDSLSLLHGEPLRSLRFVSELTLFNCSEMDTFTEQWFLQNNSTLRSLKLEKVTLRSMPGAIVRFTALETLIIWDCNLLEKIQELPSSLGKLKIRDAKSLKSLPATMVSLTALYQLYMHGADLLEELPELPTSLRYLKFRDAKSLKSLPATMASLTELRELRIENADSLHELPELPRSLKAKSIRRSDGTQLCT